MNGAITMYVKLKDDLSPEKIEMTINLDLVENFTLNGRTVGFYFSNGYSRHIPFATTGEAQNVYEWLNKLACTIEYGSED